MTDNSRESLRPEPQRQPPPSEGTIYTKLAELQRRYAITAATFGKQLKQLVDFRPPTVDLSQEQNEFIELETNLTNLKIPTIPKKKFEENPTPQLPISTGIPNAKTYEDRPTITLPSIPPPPPIPDISLPPIPEPLPIPSPSYQPERVREEEPAISLAREKVSLLVDSVTYLRNTNGITDTTYREKRTELLALSISPDVPHQIRKEIAQKIGNLAKDGVDPEFTRHLGTIVKKIAKGKTKVPLPEQDTALRALFSMKNADAEATLVQLLTGEVHPQIKKYVLYRLNEDRYKYTGFLNGLSYDFFSPLLRTDARQIDWDTLQPLTAITSMASKEIKEMAIRIVPDIYRALLHGNTPETIPQIHQANPDIPWGALLQVYQLSKISNIPLERFNEIFKAAKKSSRATDELIYSMTALLDTDSNSNALTKSEAILNGLLKEPITTDNLSLFNSALRKAMVLSRIDGIEKNGRFSRVIANVFTADKQADHTPPFSLTLTNQKLTHEIADAFTELFPGKKFDRRKIEQLVDIWEDVDPIIIYAISLAKNTYDDDSKSAFELLEDMVAHMDPPQLSEWKQWRYNLQNDTVKSQIGMLSERARTAYMADYFVSAGSLLLGQNLEQRPQEIRTRLTDTFGFDHGDEQPLTPARRIIKSFYAEAATSAIPFDEQAKKLQSVLSEQLTTLVHLGEFLNTDVQIGKNAEKSLASWHQTEEGKRKALQDIGYTSPLTKDAIEEQLRLLREDGLTPDIQKTIDLLTEQGKIKAYERAKYARESGQISPDGIPALEDITKELEEVLGNNFQTLLLANKKAKTLSYAMPKQLDQRLLKYLEKHGLGIDATQDQLATAYTATLQELAELLRSDTFLEIKQALQIPDNPTAKDIYHAVEETKTIIDVLRLSTLTPELLTRNTLTEDESASTTTISKTLDVLMQRYQSDVRIYSELKQLRDMISHETIPAEQQDYAFIFTDNPLVGLR